MNLYDRNTVTPVRATTTTGADGWWTISHATQGRFDVEVVNGTSKRRRKYDTREQLEYLEVANFRVRNPADTFEYDIVPAAITAARQLNLPLITGTDTLMVLGLNQTVTGVLTLTTPAIGAATGTSLVLTGNLSAEDLLIEDSDASHYLTITTTSNLTAARTLTIVPGDASRTVTLTGDTTLSGTNTGDVTLAGTPDYITITNQVITRAKLDPADDLNTFASSVLATLVTDETGSGALVFGTAPTIAGGAHTALTGLGIRSTGTGAFDLTIANTENLTAGRTLTITMNNDAHTLTISGNATLTGSNTGDQTITLSGDVTGSGTGTFAATIANDAVTLAKMANMATGSLLGRNTAATGDPEVITDIATAITIGGAYITRVGGTDVTVADGGTGASTLTGVIIGAGTAALTGLALTASQSIRMNAGGTAYEGFTPAGAAYGAPALTLSTTNAEGTGDGIRTGATVAAFDATVPVTQASADAAATGTAAVAARRDHRHGMPTLGSGAVTRAGGNTTEASTTSTTAVDILTTASLSIAVGANVLATWLERKTTGAANWFQTRLKLNTTVVMSGRGAGDATNSAQSGNEKAEFVYGVANYLLAGTLWAITQQGTVLIAAAFDGDMPTATLTDIVVGGRVQSASITGSIDEMHVYTFAVS